MTFPRSDRKPKACNHSCRQLAEQEELHMRVPFRHGIRLSRCRGTLTAFPTSTSHRPICQDLSELELARRGTAWTELRQCCWAILQLCRALPGDQFRSAE